MSRKLSRAVLGGMPTPDAIADCGMRIADLKKRRAGAVSIRNSQFEIRN